VGFSSTLVTLGACPASQRVSVAPVVTFPNGTVALRPGGTVLSGRMTSLRFWLTVIGFLI
jgi:AGZA family xanthine/uracil permease-like MFS transporter